MACIAKLVSEGKVPEKDKTHLVILVIYMSTTVFIQSLNVIKLTKKVRINPWFYRLVIFNLIGFLGESTLSPVKLVEVLFGML